MRIGATPWETTTNRVDVKFNHWHDRNTGRFTAPGEGVWVDGGLAGGGSFDGGGSSASWDAPSQTKVRVARQRKRPDTPPASLAVGAGATTKPIHDSTQHVVVRNGYSYTLDAAGRTRLLTGTLVLNPDQKRSRTAQASAGGSDRQKGDEGGHYIARRFNGPTDEFNHFAQNSEFNRGDYKALEDRWAKATKAGKTVFVRITPTFQGISKRPATISVFFKIDGQADWKTFPNGAKGKKHGK